MFHAARTGRIATLVAFLHAAPLLAAPDLAGHWRRNTELSQDAATRIVDAVGARDRDVSDLARQQFRERLLRLAKGAQGFDIEQEAKEVRIASADSERVRIFYPDGSEHRRESSEGLKIKVAARWSGEALVIDQHLEDGDHILERLERDGARLVHVLRWTSKRLRQPLEVRTVYDPAE